MSEQDSMSERELAEYFQTTGALTGQPRSVGEALAAADEEAPKTVEEPEETVEEPPVVVTDEPTQRDTEEGQPEPEVAATPDEEPESEDEDEDIEGDQYVVWAKKKYGEEWAPKVAKAAYEQEQHISRLAAEKKEAQEGWAEAYQYAQQVEQQAQQQQSMGMPLSAGEEEWIENSLANPYQAAMTAAMNANVTLYNGILARVAEENQMMAIQIDRQVQMELAQLAAQEQNGQMQQQPTLQESLAQSIERLGIDLPTYGAAMSAKIEELGSYDEYVQAILNGDEVQRRMGLRVVYDLVRAGAMSTRKVRSEERENQIKHEAELRRQAAGVVTGSPQSQAPPEKNPQLAAMEEEWKARGQWSED